MREFNRRGFLSMLLATSACKVAASVLPTAFLQEKDNPTWAGYDQAIIIDSLGGPGSRSTSDVFVALSPTEIEDIRKSGLTAVNLTVSGVGSYARDYEETIRTLAYWDAQISAHPEVLLHVLKTDDIHEAKRSHRLGLIYGFQDATPFGEDLNRLDIFRDLGVRIFQLTYNRRNLAGDGCLEPGNAGLSIFGRQLVERLNETGSLVDLSHAGERTTLEAIEASVTPVAITHTACAVLAPNPRNKTDAELRRLASKGGYVGIYFMPFLRSEGQPMAADLVLHIEHAINVCGEDHVGLGTDGYITPAAVTPEYKKTFAQEVIKRRQLGISAPGEDPHVYTFIPDLNSPDHFNRVAVLLSQRRHSDAQIEKILGGNFERILSEAWKPDFRGKLS